MKTCPTCKTNHSDHYLLCPLDGTPLVELTPWTEGAVVRGKYRILGRIGQGGMGTVYKAQHVRFKEICAIKAMAAELMKDPVFLKRFEQEAVLTRRLQHPNAVRVEDFDETEDGRPFIVMEYIEGRSLKDVIAQEAPLPVARACSIARQVASALDAAQHLGMIHRDIKPDNIILLGGTGVPPVDDHGQDSHATPAQPTTAKVLDFGIAKIKEGLLETTGVGMTLTGTGMSIGTPSYMSPEQALGKKGDDLDGRSDIYSLGVVLYEMLSGELPIVAETALQMMLAHVQTPPRPIQHARSGAQIPEPIARLVMQCLEKDPKLRPPTAAAFIQALDAGDQDVEPALQPAANERRSAQGGTEEDKRARLAAEAERLEQQRQQEQAVRETAKSRSSATGEAVVQRSSQSEKSSREKPQPVTAAGESRDSRGSDAGASAPISEPAAENPTLTPPSSSALPQESRRLITGWRRVVAICALTAAVIVALYAGLRYAKRSDARVIQRNGSDNGPNSPSNNRGAVQEEPPSTPAGENAGQAKPAEPVRPPISKANQSTPSPEVVKMPAGPQPEPTTPPPVPELPGELTGTITGISDSIVAFTTDAGSQDTVTLSAQTKIRRVPQGVTDMKNATPAQLSDLAVGDRILVAGASGSNGKLISPLYVVVMK